MKTPYQSSLKNEKDLQRVRRSLAFQGIGGAEADRVMRKAQLLPEIETNYTRMPDDMRDKPIKKRLSDRIGMIKPITCNPPSCYIRKLKRKSGGKFLKPLPKNPPKTGVIKPVNQSQLRVVNKIPGR